MRPLDPRLLRYASSTRGTLAAGGVLAVLQTLSIIAFAWLVTGLVVRAIAPLLALVGIGVAGIIAAAC
ncbi:hypothetical protein SB775_30635, partial [Peribacillus sp. SIMBA_075]|uniref:hypothetical protein n=1 Tax=Peribacillus sp. SIMBA_075 TaxID=3085813 RepID=UPI00397D0ED6